MIHGRKRQEKQKDKGRDSLLLPTQLMLLPAIQSERYETAKRINAY